MRVLAIMGAVMLFGCASSNTAPGASNSGVARVSSTGAEGMQAISTGAVPMVGTSTITAPVDKAWRALPAVYEMMHIPLTTIEASDHLLGNRGLQLRHELGGASLSRYLDCGASQGSPSANTYDVNLSVITQVRAVDSTHTTVSTTVDGVAKPVLFVGEYVHCATTGAIEARIAKLLEGASQQ